MLAVAASEDSRSSLRTSASGILFLLWISVRFLIMSGRWRHALASPSRWALKEPVAAAVSRRASCPVTKKGSI